MCLQQVVKALNESFIDLKELGNYINYKWPCGTFGLVLIAGLVALANVFIVSSGCGTNWKTH